MTARCIDLEERMSDQEDLDLASAALAAADPHLDAAQAALEDARAGLDVGPANGDVVVAYAAIAVAETFFALAAAGRSLLDAFVTELTADLVAGSKPAGDEVDE